MPRHPGPGPAANSSFHPESISYNGSLRADFFGYPRKGIAVVLPDVLLGAFLDWLLPLLNAVIMIIGSLILIPLILIQKGKGGGLAGAFGGAGGSSAFGSRAGDQFTRITIVVAAVWILLIMLTVKLMRPAQPAESASLAAPPAQTSRA